MSDRSCSVHPGYKTARPPTSDCITCWAAYGRRRAIDDGLRSQGKKLKKPNGAATKAKGRDAVMRVRELLLRMAPWLEPDDILVKATSMPGADLHFSPAAARWFPFCVEIKNVENFSVWAAMAQAQVNAAAVGKPPIVFFKRAGTPLYVALSATDLLTLWPKEPLPILLMPSPTPDPKP